MFEAAVRPVNKSVISPTLVNGETNDRRRFLSFWFNIQSGRMMIPFSVLFTRYLALEALDLYSGLICCSRSLRNTSHSFSQKFVAF